MRRRSHFDPELGPQADADDLIALVDSPRIRRGVLKLDREIDVYRTIWAGRDIVVKCYKHVGLIHSIRHTLKRSRAYRAWCNAKRLMEMGVTPRPLGYVDEYMGPLLWRSFLVTEFETGCRLDVLLADKQTSEGTRRRAVSQVLRLIDRMASHGISHGDMKHTNIFFRDGRAILTDLDGMRFPRLPLMRRYRRYSDIRRFLRVWTGATPASALPAQGLIRITAHNARLAIDNRFRNSPLEAALLTDPARLEGQPIASSEGSRVQRLEMPGESAPVHLYLKEYRSRSWFDVVKHLVRPDRAKRAAEGAGLLSHHGLRTPQVVAVGSLKVGLLKERCFMATIEVTDARPAQEFFIKGFDSSASLTLAERRRLLRLLGSEIGRMHRAGIVHGDLRPGNILIRRGQEDWEFFFIDNERTRKWPWIPRKLRLKNLVQINMVPTGLSRSDRLRFFQSYLLANPAVRLNYRWWAAKVMAVTYGRFRRKGWA